MFRNFIYLDEDRLYSFRRQINGANSASPKSITQKKSAGVSAALGTLGMNGAIETNIDGEFEKDVSFDYDRFELSLAALEGEDYFDFVLNDGYDLTTIPAMKLFRICSGFEIPEEFDIVNLIERFKPFIMGQIETKSSSEQEILEAIIGTASADIPFVIDYDDVTISGKLNSRYLQEEYSNLEDYADQDVYILCKVVGMARKETVEIFDPLKDFIHLPRLMRHQMKNNSNSIGFEKIFINGPVLKVEVIAIYK